MRRKHTTITKGTERRFSGKSRGLKFGPKLRPNERTRLWRKIGANCRHELRIAPRWGRNSLPRRILAKIFGVETGKMNSAAWRNRLYAKRRPERMKLHPFWKKWVLPCAFAFYAVPASIDGTSNNDSGDYEFLRRHMGLAQTEYAVSPDTALADNRFSGVGTHPSLSTIQSIRMGVKFDG